MSQAGDSISLSAIIGNAAVPDQLAEVYDLYGLQQWATDERDKAMEGVSPSTP